MRHVVAAALALAAAGLPARTADACSWAFPELATSIHAHDGRNDVPTNLVLPLVRMAPEQGENQSLWLRPVGAEEITRLDVSFDEDFTRARPPEPLEPDREYQLLGFGRSTLPTPIQWDTLESEATAVITFRTGSGADDEAPAAPTLLRSETQEVFPTIPLLTETSCGPHPGGTWARFFLQEDDGAVAYRLERSFPSVLVDTQIRRTRRIDEDEVFLGEIARDAFGLHAYRITAIDLAGNESVPVEQTMYLGCPGACASSDPTPIALVLGLLAFGLYRRRR